MTINGMHILLSAILLALVYLLMRGENNAPAGQPARPRHSAWAWISLAAIIAAVVLFIFREKLSGPNLMLWIFFLVGTVVLVVLGCSGLLIRGLGRVRPLWLIPTVFTVYLVGAVALYLLAGTEVLARINGHSPARLKAEQDVADQTYGAECFAAGEFEAARDHFKKMIEQEIHKSPRDQNPLLVSSYKQQLAKAEAKLNPSGAKGSKSYFLALGDNTGRQAYMRFGEGDPLNPTQIKALSSPPDSAVRTIIKEIHHDTTYVPVPVCPTPPADWSEQSMKIQDDVGLAKANEPQPAVNITMYPVPCDSVPSPSWLDVQNQSAQPFFSNPR